MSVRSGTYGVPSAVVCVPAVFDMLLPRSYSKDGARLDGELVAVDVDGPGDIRDSGVMWVCVLRSNQGVLSRMLGGDLLLSGGGDVSAV